MNLQNQLIETIQFHNRVIGMRTEGLNHADTMCQLPFPGNCMNWNLGHLMVYRDGLIDTINGTEHADPAEFTLYGAGSEPLTEDSKAIRFERIMERLNSGGEELITALENLDGARLDVMHNPDRNMTLGGHLNFYIAFHEAYHLGQLEPLKELALFMRR